MVPARWLRRGDRPGQEARAQLRRDVDIGQTVLGQRIRAAHIVPATPSSHKRPVLLFGAIHGDEPVGVRCLVALADELAGEPPGRDTWIVPAVNLDGLAAGTKNNARDVDLNRNFPATSWTATHAPGYAPGPTPLSEPETRALTELIDHTGCTRLIALHAPLGMVNYDGTGRALAELMAAHNGYDLRGDVGYPTPGSFGACYGGDRGLEVVTLEIPWMDEDDAWTQNRAALRLCVDLAP